MQGLPAAHCLSSAPFQNIVCWRLLALSQRTHDNHRDKQRILPLRPVSRISAPLGHPLTIHWRSDRQISNVGVPGGPRAHAVLRNLRGHSALRRSTRSSVPKDNDTRRSEPIYDGPWHADAPVPMHRPAKRRRGRGPTAVPIPWGSLPSRAGKLVSGPFRRNLEEAVTLVRKRARSAVCSRGIGPAH